MSAPTASATVGRSVSRDGNCRAGPGEWDLNVKRVGVRRLRVRFEIDDIGRGQRWQVFVASNGHRVAAVSRSSGSSADVSVTRFTRNRKGHDRIRAAAVNPGTGSICRARLRF
jgi:hypothetical protein